MLTSAKDVDPGNLEDTQVARNSVDEVVSFISNECDAIAAVLPPSQDAAQTGRITKGAALALKARTLLYAASPLFNGNQLYAVSKTKMERPFLIPLTIEKKMEKGCRCGKGRDRP